MSALFYLPSSFWSLVNSQSGMALQSLINASKEYHNESCSEEREKKLEIITKYFFSYADNQKAKKTWLLEILCVLKNRARGNFMITCYLITKVLYLTSCIGQFFLISYLLDFNLNSYSLKAIYEMSQGNDLIESHYFPRVTMCHFKIRRLGTVDNVNLQCVLPVNLFNEKIFIFLWIWIIFNIIVHFFSTLRWIIFTASFIDRKRIVNNLLVGNRSIKYAEEYSKYLRLDGVFILKMISKKSNSITASDIAKSVYDCYEKERIDPENTSLNL